ncbi:MAG: hypothetical protein DWQ01_12890 [Planctomycetota bacterium]|nr:MAG: hypothetical protein DWQ01_12890 [Planctomycetota bacterium]
MKFFLPSSLVFLAIASWLPAQNPRPSLRVDSTAVGAAQGPAVSTRGELTALAWHDQGDGGIYVSTSDGRGLSWSTPVRIDGDLSASAKTIQADSVHVVGDAIYVLWEDERHGASNRELYFNFSENQGASWQGEVRLDKTQPIGTGSIRDWHFWADNNDTSGLPDYVYVVFTVDPDGASNEELYAVVSEDAGFNFHAPVHVPQDFNPGDFDIDAITMSGHDRHISVIWQDNRAGTMDDIWFQHSHYSGSTWNTQDHRVDTDPAGAADADGSVATFTEGLTVVAAWQDERTSTTVEELRWNVSYNMGSNWLGSDVLIGNYTPGVDDVDNPAVAIQNGVFLVAWEDNRSGQDEIYLATSLDGSIWTETQVSTQGGGFPAFSHVTHGEADAVIALTWTSGAFPNVVETAYSRDNGTTWTTGMAISDTTGDADFAVLDYNQLYGNVIQAWLADDSGTNGVYAGGFRPPTLHPVGTFSGGQSVHFEIEHFQSFESGYSFGVLLSGGLDQYLLPDSRNTGLLDDFYLQRSLDEIPGLLSGTVLSDGSGSTPVVIWPFSIPPGTVLNLVAVSFDISAFPTIVLGGITDIETITVQ